jgi:acetyl esterase/lipase
MKQIVQQTFSIMDAGRRRHPIKKQTEAMQARCDPSNWLTTALSILLVCGSAVASRVAAQPAGPGEARVEKNVVYGMYSGLALLMDVYHPATRNGIGVVYIPGSAWHAPLAYNATQLKNVSIVGPATQPLVEAGYTVFVINHRQAPRFRYPAPIEDAQRAVRFTRHYAERFGIHPEFIGAAGHSSGACVALLLGLLDEVHSKHPDPVERKSAKVQAVASLAAPTDFINVQVSFVQSSYLGLPLFDRTATSSEEYQVYRNASPVFHATQDDAPTLLLHGNADTVVPFQNSGLMHRALTDAGVTVRRIDLSGGGHFPPYPPHAPDPFLETVKWFDEHLLPHASALTLGAVRVGQNGMELSIQGPPGLRVEIERSSDLDHWQSWTSGVLGTGALELSDPEINTQQFYRAR